MANEETIVNKIITVDTILEVANYLEDKLEEYKRLYNEELKRNQGLDRYEQIFKCKLSDSSKIEYEITFIDNKSLTQSDYNWFAGNLANPSLVKRVNIYYYISYEDNSEDIKNSVYRNVHAHITFHDDTIFMTVDGKELENEESNITEKIVDENNTSENITEENNTQENNTQENVTEPEQNHEEENNYYEPEYPSYNPPRYEESKSENANLRIIKIENMEPEFDKDTTEYYLTVDLNTEKIDIETYTDSEKAKVAIYGNENLKEGKNTIEIVVTAEAGNQKTYYIYVTKIDNAKMANANLQTLEIEGASISPKFKNNIYSYNVTIDKNTKKLNILAKPENEKSKIEIVGNSNLKEGENIIKIIVTAEDGTTTRTYKINAYTSLNDIQVQEEDKKPAIVVLGILGITILIMGIIVITKNKKI